MARKRMIDPSIWGSEDFSHLSTLAKLVFIGLFSNADDEGRGRAKPVYIKSILFPYDEQMRVTDIEKSLQEIAAHMSITFYAHDGTEYYSLDNWTEWQKVEKPTLSRIPAFGEDSGNSRGVLDDESRLIEENRIRIEEKKKKKGMEGDKPPRSKFIPPTVEEVLTYCKERRNQVDAQTFVDFYMAKGWKVGKDPMKDWKASVRTWEHREGGTKQDAPPAKPRTGHFEVKAGQEVYVYGDD